MSWVLTLKKNILNQILFTLRNISSGINNPFFFPSNLRNREAFDTKENPYLPEEILWRQKEQFGDGVGYKWTEGIQDHVNKIIPDDIYNMRKKIFPLNTPTSKEMFWLRTTFEKYFPNDE